nr:TniQ family protein [Marinicella sp. W31]MDC2878351.1 TniQ family protein [Marinicella sp. W31]
MEPQLPFYDDELAQGYLARSGQFHTGASLSQFRGYWDIGVKDIRDGTEDLVQALSALSGVEADHIRYNTLVAKPDGNFTLRGETFNLPFVRRGSVTACLECLADDHSQAGWNPGSRRFRWQWLLRPVVCCALHQTQLVEFRLKDCLDLFDVEQLLALNDFEPGVIATSVDRSPGLLQQYVSRRFSATDKCEDWLGSQTISGVVKASEMLGALLADGPSAPIKEYVTSDWARVGDVGFKTYSAGTEAILTEFKRLCIDSGCSSGRAGPQAAYGYFFRWLKKRNMVDGMEPLRSILRTAIVENFALDAGEVVLGETLPVRRMHSANSLASATGISKSRISMLMRKAGMLPATAKGASLNRWAFPADAAEKVIARTQEAVSLRQVRKILGCSATQAERLAHSGLISPIIPVTEGQHGIRAGGYVKEELEQFLANICNSCGKIDDEVEGYRSLWGVTCGRSSTEQILEFQLKGEFRDTKLIKGINRIDHLRFNTSEVKAVLEALDPDHTISASEVALILGVVSSTPHRLVSPEHGGPWMHEVDQAEYRQRKGKLRFSRIELQKFQERYMTASAIGRLLGISHVEAKKLMTNTGILPIADPVWMGAWLYKRKDVLRLIDNLDETAFPTSELKGAAREWPNR